MPQRQTFVIREKPEQRLRLDKFLVEHISVPSRSVLQQWIVDGHVRVNDRSVAKHYFLSQGDIVILDIPEENHTVSTASVPDVPILFEDNELLVLNKPVGLLVHAVSVNDTTPTLVDMVRAHIPTLGMVGDNPLRPGIVHRLDRAVSGVMVVAKTEESFQNLRQQFHDRMVIKEYRAIVHGVPAQEHFVLQFRIAHSKNKGGKMAARPEHAEGKDAWTECDILETYHHRYALLAIHIRTGRTHQIRAHCAAMDHPIVGDRRYRSKRYHSDQRGTRLFLHSYQLSCTHPTTGTQMRWMSAMPAVFTELLHPAAVRVR